MPLQLQFKSHDAKVCFWEQSPEAPHLEPVRWNEAHEQRELVLVTQQVRRGRVADLWDLEQRQHVCHHDAARRTLRSDHADDVVEGSAARGRVRTGYVGRAAAIMPRHEVNHLETRTR